MKRRLGKVLVVMLVVTLLGANLSGFATIDFPTYTAIAQTNGNPKGDVLIESNWSGRSDGPSDNPSLTVFGRTTVTYTAIPADGYRFVKWTRNYGPNSPDVGYPYVDPISIQVEMNQNAQYVAHFERLPEPEPITITGLVGLGGGGSVLASPDDGSPLNDTTVLPGEPVTLTAVPNVGFIFSHWTDPSGAIILFAGPELNLPSPMESATYTAYFEPIFVFEGMVDGISADPLTGSVDGPYFGPYFTPVTLTAIPAPGYEVDRWEGFLGFVVQTGGNTFDTTFAPIPGIYTVYFRLAYYDITVGVASGHESMGTAGSSESDIPISQTRNIWATPNFGYGFDYWTLNDNVIQGGSSLTVDSSMAGDYLAHFEQLPDWAVDVSVAVGQEGMGTAGSSETDIPSTETRVISAAENFGYAFDYWTYNGSRFTGDTSSTLTVDYTTAGAYVAHFVQLRDWAVDVSVALGQEAMGTAGTTESGIPAPETRTITATPNVGFKFVRWTWNGEPFSGDTSPTLTLNYTQAGSYVAIFSELNYYYITVSPDENNGLGGNITTIDLVPGTGLTDGFGNYTTGSQLIFNATAGPEYEFIQWIANDGTYTVGETDEDFIGDFEMVYYTITTSLNIGGAGSVIVNSSPVLKTHSAQVIATFNPGYAFVEYIDIDTGLSLGTSPLLDLTPTRDMNILAVYTESDIPPEPGPEPQPEPEPEPEPIPEEPIPEDIPEEPVPEAIPEPEPEPEPEEDILDEDIPEDVPMPQTAGIPAGILVLAGSAIAGLGVKMRKHKQD